MWLYVWQWWGGRDDNYWVIQPILCLPDVLIHPKWKSLISPNPQHVGSFKASGFPGGRKSVPIVGACDDCRGRAGVGGSRGGKKLGQRLVGWCVVSLQQLRQGPVLKAQAGMLHPSSRAPLLPGRPLCTLTAKPALWPRRWVQYLISTTMLIPAPLKRNCSPRFTV